MTSAPKYMSNIIHFCELCGKELTNEEALNSSVKVRNLCKGESSFLWDCWVSDFCDKCVSEHFETWDDFVDYRRSKIELDKKAAEERESS